MFSTVIQVAALILAVVLYFYFTMESDGITVQIKQGILQGRVRSSLEETKFYSFQSIPYAKPPINELRFKPPIPHQGWTGVLDATKNVPLCYQVEHIGQEDCLYLNVYTKNVLDLKSNDLKPVMVYIHGGGFVEGHSHEALYNPEFLMIEDVVIVSLNYRLGILGFLSIESKEATQFLTANAGMKDQVLALKWVQNNIKEFGGDPSRVTIFGQSAGAVSVVFHLFSPLSKGLFQQAIVQSSAWCVYSMGKPNGREIAEKLNLNEKNPIKLLERLQKVPLKDLINAQNEVFGLMHTGMELYSSPIVEGESAESFLTANPLELLKQGKFNKVSAVYGVTDKEGIIVDIVNKKNAGILNILYNIEHVVPWELQGDKRVQAVQQIKEYYYKNSDPNPETDAHILIDIITDSWFYYPTYYFAKLHSQYNSVYFYEFSADTALNFYKKQHPITATYKGASHVDDLGYLWKCNDSPIVKVGSLEHKMIRRSVNMWTNFAKFGERIYPEWLPVNHKNVDFDYLEIGNEIKAKVNPNKERMDLWANLLGFE